MRFPAEWEPQSAVLIAWPHAGTDWADRLAQVEETYIALVAAITRHQPVVVCVANDDIEAYARARLSSARVQMDQVAFETVAYDDTWLRDSGPITLVQAATTQDGIPSPTSDPLTPPVGGAHAASAARTCAGEDRARRFQLLDFRFTGWGGKYDARLDDQLVQGLEASGVFIDSCRQQIDFALEGGAIETDGAGTLLTTWQCLHERHPDATRQELSSRLCQWLQQDRVLWLDHGALEGDDTDAHIDTLARFAAPDAIVYQACDDPDDPHYADLQAMAAEIAALRTTSGEPYRLFPLPWPRPILDEGRRLAASYANFLVINDAVLMPAYGDPADTVAQAVLAEAFPAREIVAVPCRSLIWQNGSLHCITMQLPRGLVA